MENGRWCTRPIFGEEVKIEREVERVEGEVRMFESRTHRMSYFAARNGRIRLLILGFTPTTSSPVGSSVVSERVDSILD
jgi:hypothetical protein